MTTTKLEQLINPQVMGDMVKAKIDAKLQALQLAKIDRTLVGRAGNTITVPAWDFIGEAKEVAEGVECDITQMTTTEAEFTIKKVMKAVDLTDEAVLSGLGDPVSVANDQLSKSVLVKIDNDIVEVISDVTKGVVYDGSANIISYASIVNALDVLEEEADTQKVIYIHPKQLTQLRLDPEFIANHKIAPNLMVTGAVGMIAGCSVKVSKKVKKVGTNYINPIVLLSGDAETADEAPAVTIFMKKEAGIEKERKTTSRKTVVSIDEHYGVAVTNQSKLVKLKAKAAKA